MGASCLGIKSSKMDSVIKKDEENRTEPVNTEAIHSKLMNIENSPKIINTEDGIKNYPKDFKLISNESKIIYDKIQKNINESLTKQKSNRIKIIKISPKSHKILNELSLNKNSNFHHKEENRVDEINVDKYMKMIDKIDIKKKKKKNN